MQKYFPRGEININEFKEFCSHSDTKNVNLDNLYKYFDFEQDGTVTKSEFKYRIVNTNYEENNEKNPLLVNQMIKHIIK